MCGFLLLILATIRHNRFTIEIHCGAQRRRVYLAGRAEKPFHFCSDRNVEEFYYRTPKSFSIEHSEQSKKFDFGHTFPIGSEKVLKPL